MQSKVSMTRWFGFLDSARQFAPTWHRRLLLQIFLCISTGKTDAAANTFSKRSLPPRSADGDRASTGKDSDDIRRVRSACKNTLEFSTLVLADEQMLLTCKVIMAVLSPMREWQTQQSKALRSCAEVCDWYMAQACGQA